ncbi:MAG: hypothetical protein A3H69_00280 [Candidatus Sungbacteria bacterium RIFCSPLOWO2_02_FULL_47_9]|uniref:Response regulatory domain-containing protein n=1 Tax=Candidatus Sungbacteria bacterium RIFCSPHIGHO2_01_FULL_47_32 TaxID=1802264 RepID=A0A1G2K432_9BACT|nr:MAG: Response regulator receiver domain-containing protein [Parcubacteria group bacterium GW2011_GWA2_47_10]OGZ94167.1 MAG: hypothetical protein A2633_02875 [Candidatus Sungbacteria bacterium RIFCSPHIGHO2_01_FULL_47_32]OGZ98649.1 MAG: hypothetical protein A3D57_04335 [Candidatus Sungbacteria bacterium RIFCSPHIGHO2_02_FULL_46_12]OHA06269.1 MAG: hypothetical protein A3A28_02130 [Candidatus Sungbacteria bacterium RIFCSPLOWO2_01_FULL_47_32]OHA09770.1 MAG: hypothetical protein A3H69_00280 [Candid
MDETRRDSASQAGEKNGKARLLIIEDDVFLRNLLVNKLAKDGYVISDAIDGPSALKLLETERPDLILMDLLLPGMDGFAVLREMKKSPELAKIPVIVLSNLGSQEDIDRVMALGASDYLIKANFTLDEIVKRINQILEEKYFKLP